MSDLPSEEQLNVRHTQLEHITVYQYPCPCELDGPWEDVSQLIEPRKNEQRHDPLHPLVESDTVKQNTGWAAPDRVGFWSINAATHPRLNLSDAIINDEDMLDIDILAHECNVLHDAVGVTQIMACLVAKPQPPPGEADDDADEFWVMVRRNTSHRQSVKKVAAVISSTKRYCFPYEDLVARSDSPSLVLRTLYHLIGGVSDRAVQHSAMLREQKPRQNVAEAKFEWAWSHAIRMDEVVSRKVERIVPDTVRDGDECSVCTKQLSNIDCDDIGWYNGDEDDVMVDSDAVADVDPDHDAVKADCGHLFGRSCLVEAFESSANGLYLKCHVCQEQVLTQKSIDAVVFGTVNGEYIRNTGFSNFENFERSCADLDNWTHIDLDERITMNRPIFKRAWGEQVRGAEMEEASSTPSHLQLARSPEMEAVDRLVRKYLTDHFNVHEYVSDTIRNFANKILQEVYHGLLRAGLDTLRPYLTNDEVLIIEGHLQSDSFIQHPMDDLHLLVFRRPWLMERARILVVRALRYLVCRQCRCDLTEDCNTLLHQHGERTFYHPEHR